MIMARFTSTFEIDPQTDHDLSIEGRVKISDRATMEEWPVLAEAAREAVLSMGRSFTKDK